MKRNILRHLVDIGCTVRVVPPTLTEVGKGVGSLLLAGRAMGDTFAAMPRRPQETMGGLVYNMLNRAVPREVSRNKTPAPFSAPPFCHACSAFVGSR